MGIQKAENIIINPFDEELSFFQLLIDKNL